MKEQPVEGYRLSPQQRRLWRVQGANSPLRSRCAIQVAGRLEPATLKHAVTRVIHRHHLLRARLVKRPGIKFPLQVLGNEVELRWEDLDLRGAATSGREAALRHVYESETNLDTGSESAPVVLAKLVHFDERDRVFILSLPAMLADAWAVAMLVREIGRACGDGARPAEAIEDDFHYFRFAEWQNELVDSEDEQAVRGKAYWSKETAHIVSPTLPQEREIAEATAFIPARATVEPQAVESLREVAVRFRLTERDVLAAAWTALIGVLSGQEEIVIWEVVDGRKYDELQGAVGLYAKSIPVRARLEAADRFADLLRRRSETARANYELHEYYNSDEHMLRLRMPGQHPIGFEYIEGDWWPAGEGASFKLLRQDCYIDRFKLQLSCLASGDGLRAELRYDAEVYDRSRVEQMAGWFGRLLAQVARDPDVLVNHLDLPAAGERHHLLVELNDTERRPASGRCIHEGFEEQALLAPDAVAAVFEEEFLSYGELNRRANRLARHLQSMGVAADRLVGLYLDRSVDLLVGILGILKAGGAYVPLDPVNPGKRLAMMLEDLGNSIVVTSQPLAAALREYPGRLVCLDADLRAVPGLDDCNPVSGCTAANLVYSVFTSGSTGRPKAVAVEHRQLDNYVRGIMERLALPAGASFATVSTFAADLGNTAIYASLLTGGCLHLIALERATDPQALSLYFSRHRIDCLKIVPSHLAALVASSSPESLMPRRWLVLGGETSRTSWAEELARLSPECAVFNHYGPTETTVGVLTFRLSDSGVPAGCQTLPLGRPIPNARAYVLGAAMQVLPPGVAGELYIGGDGVARGYVNRPELTAERFIPDPYSPWPGARLYRTGDVTRHLRDGRLEFLGRRDDQVKFHGHRVELNEIRLGLNRHRLIRDSVVVVAKDHNGEGVIVAYYVARQEIEVGQLRSFLAESVLEETLPNVFVHLKRLPLTINGKIDYRALPSLEEAKKSLKRSYIAPRTPTERMIADIWASVLGLDRIGVEDNFFEMGGHSLLATQVISRMRAELDMQVPLRALFDNPTLQKLAEVVEGERLGQMPPEEAAIRTVSRTGELPLSFAQQRLWFIHQLDPQSPAYNIQFAIYVGGVLDLAALRQSLNEVARRHEVLRTRFAARRGAAVQVIDERPDVRLMLWDLSALSEGEREMRAQEIAGEESARPFDLERGPVWRAAVLRLARQEHVLLLSLHHIASDGWSTGVLSREVTAIYEQYRQGQRSPLAELALQYADFAVWQREWLQGEVLEEHLRYWRRQLEGATELRLPTDRPRPAVASHRGVNLPFTLSAEVTQGLKELSQQEGATMFMTLLAAFKVVLSRYSGQENIVVGTDVANRNRLETEALIGFFVNELVLRTDLSGNPTFRELLRRVRATTLEAYAHQDVPFERLVQELVREREPGRSPLFQVKLVFQNAPEQALQVGGVAFSGFGPDYTIAKFDLSLHLSEGPNGVSGAAAYATDLYERASVERMLADLQSALARVVADPDSRLTDLLAAQDRGLGALREFEHQTFKLARRRALNPAEVDSHATAGRVRNSGPTEPGP